MKPGKKIGIRLALWCAEALIADSFWSKDDSLRKELEAIRDAVAKMKVDDA